MHIRTLSETSRHCDFEALCLPAMNKAKAMMDALMGPSRDVSNKDNYTAVSPENDNYEAKLEEATFLQTIFLIFALCTIVTAFAITFVSCTRMLRATQKAHKMESIRRQVEAKLLFVGACSFF